MRWPHTNIPTRLYLGFGALVILGVSVACYAGFQMSSVDGNVRSMTSLAENFQAVLEGGRLLEIQRRAEYQFAVDGDQKGLQESRDAAAKVLKLLSVAEEAAASGDRKSALGQVADLMVAHEGTLRRYVDLSQVIAADRDKLISDGDEVMTRLGAVTDRARTALDPATVQAADDVERSFLLVRVSNWRNMASLEKKGLLNFKRSAETARASIERLATLGSPEVRQLIGSLGESLSAYVGTFEKTFSDRTGMASLLNDEMVPQTLSMSNKLRLLSSAMQGEFAASAASGQSTLKATAAVQMVLALALFVIGVGLAILIARSIAVPVTAMTQAMLHLARGDLSVQVPAPTLGRHDEIGAMAGAVNIFKANGLQMRAAEAEAASLRQQADAERARIEIEKAAEAAQDQVAISAVADGLDAFTNGDLTFRITRELEPKAQRLKEDYNKTAERLSATMGVIAHATLTMRSSTTDIAHAADDLARRTEQQAASLEETAAALDEITATVRRTSAGTVEACAVVSAAKGDALRSGDTVKQAVKAMNDIEASSRQMSQIIGVIDEIAFQTNLLALNAGVEAARAGDSGRGFAVVASEVRGLARRSAEAAKEIKVLISVSGQKVALGVGLVDETGRALERIAAQVADIDGIVGVIASSTHEQANGLEQVNRAIIAMDQATQLNATMVEQSTAASHSLARETLELTRLVEAFRTRDADTLVTTGRSKGDDADRRSPEAALRLVGGTRVHGQASVR